MKSVIFALSVVVILVIGCQNTITEKEAKDIADGTEEVTIFLDLYSRCEGCSPDDHPNLIGCVEYAAKKSQETYTVEYWVSEACSFRYGSSLPQEKIMINIDSRTGAILKRYPDIEYIRDPDYCRKDEDCLCKSGSGMPFVGCGNFLHAPTHFAGSYGCEMCSCIDGSCKAIV